MGFGAMKFDVTDYPVAVSLFGAVGVMVVAQYLTDVVHQFQFRIGFNFPFQLPSTICLMVKKNRGHGGGF
jgi:hypothetical protein